MGHKNKQTLTPLIKEMKKAMQEMAAYGQSKHSDKLVEKATGENISKDKIYSYNTMKTYQKHLIYFLRDTLRKHKNIRNLSECKQYVEEWVNSRIDTYSPYTVKMELSALAKLYHKSAEDYAVEIPKRIRNEIKRSRGTAVRDNNFSVENNRELISLLKVSGMRRREVANLKPEWLYSESGKYFIHVTEGAKGGRPRTIPLLDTDKKSLEIAINKIVSTPAGKRVFSKPNSTIDIHAYRHNYVKNLYRKTARPYNEFCRERLVYRNGKIIFAYQSSNGHRDINQIKKFCYVEKGEWKLKPGYKEVSSRYFCRGNDRPQGQAFDRRALDFCSRAVGYSRTDVTLIYLLS